MRDGFGRTGGVVLNITGQVMQNLAAVLMCFGQQGHPSAKRRSLWYFGVVLIVFGALAVFASYGVAEQSLLGALISVQFVSNMIFCRCIFGKPITLMMCAGTAVIVGGTLLCILNAPQLDHEVDDEELERLYLRNPVFQRFLLGEAMVWILMDKLYTTYLDAHQRGHSKWGHEVMLPCMFVARAALPGSFSVVAAKNLAVLLKLTMEGRNMLGSPLLWLNLFFWLGGTAYWMRRMNAALALFNGPFVIPLCQVNWSCFTIVTGGVFFEEFNHFAWDNAILFVLGVCGNFAGVMILQPRKGGSAKVKDPDAEQTCPEETPVQQREALAHGATLNDLSARSPAFLAPVRARGNRSVSKTSNFSCDTISVMSNTSSPCPSTAGRERKHHISTVGLIPLVLDGVQEERTESNHSSGRRDYDQPSPLVLERLVQLEELQMKQHLEVIGRIGELVSALNASKVARPVLLHLPSDTGTPASDAPTLQPTPPDAPLPPSSPPPPVAPLPPAAPPAMLPAEEAWEQPPRPAPSPRPAAAFVTPRAAAPQPRPRGLPSPPPPELGPPPPHGPTAAALPALAGPPPAEGHAPAPAGLPPRPAVPACPPHPTGTALAGAPHAAPCAAMPAPVPPPPPPDAQAAVGPRMLGRPGGGAGTGAGGSAVGWAGPAAVMCPQPSGSAAETEEAAMPGA